MSWDVCYIAVFNVYLLKGTVSLVCGSSVEVWIDRPNFERVLLVVNYFSVALS
jgi:hypothetical protein